MIERLKKNWVNLILILGLVVGIGLLAYPSIANYWNSFHQTRAIMVYSENISGMDKEDYEKILNEAREYNEDLGRSGIKWTMSDEDKAIYNEKLKADDSGIMGFISIPKVHIKLPIYHGTDEAVLQVAIGHIEGTSLPVGGEGTHCIVSGHRGLPSARLFTDIDRLKEGDTWTITVLNEMLTYEVDTIRIVEPKDLSALKIEEGKDLCTLVTCTPYGVNTHRLLVMGHRVPNADGTANVTADGIRIEPIYIAPVLGVAATIIIFIVLLIAARRARKKDTRENMLTYLEEKGIKKQW